MQKSNIFIISGPSGAGEDSIIEGLAKHIDFERIKTTTTRDMRNGESQGNPYYFVSKGEFDEILKRGDFVEHAQQYNNNFYGVTKAELERIEKLKKVGIWKIEYKGVMTVKKMFPEIIAILINTVSLEVLENRIRTRDNAPEEYIQERMKYTKQWLKHKDLYDYEVINEDGQLEKAIMEVKGIIESNK
jgi:guanylate kinase